MGQQAKINLISAQTSQEEIKFTKAKRKKKNVSRFAHRRFSPKKTKFGFFARNSTAIRVVKFSSGGYKIRKILAKESTYPKEIIEFEFWNNGELSKIEHHFSNEKI